MKKVQAAAWITVKLKKLGRKAKKVVKGRKGSSKDSSKDVVKMKPIKINIQ